MKIGQNLLLLISVATLINVATCDVTRDCHVIIDACRQNATCSTALENVDSICKVIEKKCAAKFVDIPTCADYLDILRSQQFFGNEQENSCRCNQKSPICSKINDYINTNPCVYSIASLRKYDEMPVIETTTESTTVEPTTTTQQQHKTKTRKSSKSSLRATEKTTKIPSKKVVATHSGEVLLSGDKLRSNITKFEYVTNKIFNHTDKKKAENPEQYLALNLSLIIFILLFIVAVVYFFVRRTTARKKKDDGNTKEPLVA